MAKPSPSSKSLLSQDLFDTKYNQKKITLTGGGAISPNFETKTSVAKITECSN